MQAQCCQLHQRFFTVAFQEKQHAEPKKRKSKIGETNDLKDSESSKSVKKLKKSAKKNDGDKESRSPDDNNVDIFEIDAKKPESSTELSVPVISSSITKKSIVAASKKCDETLLKDSAEDDGSSLEEGEYSNSEDENASNSDDSSSSDSDGNKYRFNFCIVLRCCMFPISEKIVVLS